MEGMTVLSVLTYRDGKVGIWRFDPGTCYTDNDGVKRFMFTEVDMHWVLFRYNLPKDFLTKLCMLELSPVGSTAKGVGVFVDVATDTTGEDVQHYTIFLPADTDLVSLFPLPALKL